MRPQPYKEIAKLIRRPRMPAGTIRSAVKRFLAARRVRGRKEGWRKTTPAEDAKILAAFRKVRKPLGSLVEKNDVWKALPLALREKVSARTVSRRLRDKGYVMEEKLTGDDHGEQWRKRRLRFCKTGSAVVPGWFRGGSAADLGWFRGGSGWFRVVPRPNWRLRSKAWARGSAATNLWFLSCFPRILHAAPA